MDFSIEKIKAREILDSRGNPTVEVELKTKAGISRAAVPSGASTGKNEALELRDSSQRYHGKGVRKAVKNVNKVISKEIRGMDVREQERIDRKMLELDGTENKSGLGANAILGVSLAVLKSSALCLGKPVYRRVAELAGCKKFSLPAPQMNIINGGVHVGMENDIQEHMIVPVKFKSFREALRAGAEVYHTLKNMLRKKYGPQAIHLGDEGGFAPPVRDPVERLEMITQAVEKAGYSDEILLALDCAASEFYSRGKYILSGKEYSSGELVEYYRELTDKFKIVSIEDGFSEEDWEGWKEMREGLGSKIQIVGDDLLVTNTERIKKAVEEKACNALLLKVNQIGTVIESLEAAQLASDSGWNTVVSHRSGETTDSTIADLVVGLSELGANQAKFGAPARGERTAKYNRLLRIEEEVGEKSIKGIR